MQHENFTEKISMWFDDELNQAEVTELKHHLAECPHCQQIYQSMQRVHELFRTASSYMVTPSPGFSTRFTARLAHHHPHGRRQMWLGLSVLLVGTLFFFTIGAVVGGLTLVGAWQNWLDINTVYYGLGFLGAMANNMLTLVNLAQLVFKVALLTMSQPIFWGFVAVAIALTIVWVRLMRQIYQREPVNVQLLVF